MNNYLIKSDSISLIDKKIKDIIKERKFDEALVTTYDLDEDSISRILEDADTISFLAPLKVIIVKNFTNKNFDNEKELKLLNKYLDNSSNEVLLIFTTSNIDARKKYIKELVSKLKLVNVNIDPKEIIKSILKDYNVEQKVINFLTLYYNDNLERLISECHKLQLAFIDTKIITYNDALELLIKPLNNQDSLTFDLVRNMALKDKRSAIKVYNELLNYNIESYSLIGLLESQYRLLYQVKVLNKQNVSSKDMASILDVHPFRIKKTLELVVFYSLKEIKKLLIDLSNIDYKIKSGVYENNIIIDLLILNIK